MHEFGMVDEFIHQLVARWMNTKKKPRKVIRVLYGPGLAEESLRQAFEVHTVGTPLEKTVFEFHKKPVSVPCQCGALVREGTEEADIPYAICQDCQHVIPIPGFNVLELIDAD
jgi:Zn finger protein HypA/HybF involved in hydrogenase expression